ncbi:3-oxo-5-alpha-steroid 4-dehydrogenase [Algiphilus sp.]|uniref:3-oxo-5-alpha-steroid 4-dehydrogenase n=1 Tax=Algiphilus sp. TaxID=1872431 RepID=UPI003B51B5BF
MLAFTTNVGIAFINASVLSWSSIGDYDGNWLQDPRFVVGVLIFVTGYVINRKADAMLAALRSSGHGGYRIPRGWLFERVSCPNYLGEFLIWIGWAVATWSLAGAVFALWTVANLLPRALSHHAWYRAQFPDYPTARKAVIPGVL